MPKRRLGPYQLQAAISAVHAQSPSWAETDWLQVSLLYERLHAYQPSPVVRINQAVAVSYAQSLEAALALLNEAASNGKLDNYQPYFAAKADFLARSGERAKAKDCLAAAIRQSGNDLERAFLESKAALL